MLDADLAEFARPINVRELAERLDIDQRSLARTLSTFGADPAARSRAIPGYGRRSRSRRSSAAPVMPPSTCMRASAYGSPVGCAKPRSTVVAAR